VDARQGEIAEDEGGELARRSIRDEEEREGSGLAGVERLGRH